MTDHDMDDDDSDCHNQGTKIVGGWVVGLEQSYPHSRHSLRGHTMAQYHTCFRETANRPI